MIFNVSSRQNEKRYGYEKRCIVSQKPKDEFIVIVHDDVKWLGGEMNKLVEGGHMQTLNLYDKKNDKATNPFI